MADWRFKIDVAESFQKAKAGEVTRQQLAGEISAKLKPIAKMAEDVTLEYLIEEFEYLADQPTVDVEDLDGLMEDLFDWGDTPLNDSWPRRKMCWINVAFPSATP